MPRLTLTDLVDIVSRAGSPKATKVREIKNRPAYAPAQDFYKGLREGLVELHRLKQGKPALSPLASPPDAKKTAHYASAVAGYKKWWGQKSLSWFDPPRNIYSAHGIEVAVNPTLGLHINGLPHVITLHLKSDKLTKVRADLICELMAVALSPSAPANAVMCVLDVRNSKLFVAGAGSQGLQAMINAELAYVASLWPYV